MEDKTIMEGLLHDAKSACDLYLHGTIESSTSNIHSAFDAALEESLKIEKQIYQKMSEKGWYPTEQEQEQKIQKVKQKFQQSQSQQEMQSQSGSQGMQGQSGMQG